ncbi:BrnT family toxin [Blastomonas aquatica]|uniref:Uncharacterized protein n=1 Tax=Blastomonas aquatica TaxID=1510276 RepID=A0ABQ1J5L1_9SPHN|nr:BrnT family toxin [Blastomonas aquatica]GGB59300.1 hypothetical protein GCM10010833_12650 [Blastomonas aquatica]
MDIEFDRTKDEINRFKHGVSLSFDKRVFDEVGHLVIGSSRPIDGEDRFKVTGKVDGRHWTASMSGRVTSAD